MNVLALNVGSSSLKYTLFSMPREAILAESSGAQTTEEVFTHCQALGVDAIGHRVVHGGPRFIAPTLVTEEVLDSLRNLSALDPVHNPAEVAALEQGMRLLPNVPTVAVFDTAFHQSLPPVAACYALPHALSERLELRRYGFHGTSYKYVSQRLLACLGRAAIGTKLIICHLGNGASVCALRDGKSIDTSMGFTPLEGLIMGTRCGDIDAGLLLYLLRTQAITPAQLDTLLNQQSGLKGLGGHGGDIRLLERAAADGAPQAELALAAFAYRVRKYIGAYAAALGGVDALVFTGGIGEHSAGMRGRICDGLAFLGIALDPERNATMQATETLLSPDSSPTPVWKIPTDEQRQLAREIFTLLHEKTP